MVAVVLLQEVQWVVFTPLADSYCTAHHAARDRVAISELAADLPVGRPLLMHGDNYSLALASGRPAVSLSPAEWKQSHAARYLLAGGRGAAFYALDTELDADNSTSPQRLRQLSAGMECRERSVRQREFMVCSVNGGPEAFTVRSSGVAVAQGRVHPRLLALTPADAMRLHREAFVQIRPDAIRGRSGDSGTLNNEP